MHAARWGDDDPAGLGLDAHIGPAFEARRLQDVARERAFGYDFRAAVEMIREANARLNEAGLSLDTDPRRVAKSYQRPRCLITSRNKRPLV
jgi:hypothetical protein